MPKPCTNEAENWKQGKFQGYVQASLEAIKDDMKEVRDEMKQKADKKLVYVATGALLTLFLAGMAFAMQIN